MKNTVKAVITMTSLSLSCLLSVSVQAECTSNRNAAMPISKPDSLYINHGDGTISDSETGLMWQQCSLGINGNECLTGSITAMTWQQALAAAASNSDFSYSDWRLPNKNELASLQDNACFSPAINETLFPASSSSFYWSSSPYILNNSYAWNVSFGNGDVGNSAKNIAGAVRLVRN
ncbi:MAG: DUF1566 domain-containing protein [Pseudomonadales bacterium]|nr:DUF1566 domain-containing protein [Pseudomonadales bacterium]